MREERITQFDLCVLLPTFYRLIVMNPNGVQNQIDLSTSILDQSFHEFNESVGIHRTIINHKPCLTLISNRGDKIYPFFFCRKSESLRFSTQGITAAMFRIGRTPSTGINMRNAQGSSDLLIFPSLLKKMHCLVAKLLLHFRFQFACI